MVIDKGLPEALFPGMWTWNHAMTNTGTGCPKATCPAPMRSGTQLCVLVESDGEGLQQKRALNSALLPGSSR